MARINKFATLNLNDTYGKREPRPNPADNGNPTGSRPRVAAHGGMLVLTRPVKQPPVLGKTVGLSSSSPKREGIQVPANPREGVKAPEILSSNTNGENEKKKGPEVDAAAVSNPGKDVSVAPSVDNSKVEESQVISLRPQGRPDVYMPPAARISTQAVTLPPSQLPSAAEIQGPRLPRDGPVQAVSPPSSAALENPQPKVGEEGLVKNAEVIVPEGSSTETVVSDCAQQQAAPRPQPFRPPQMRGDGRAAAMATVPARSEAEPTLGHPPPARPSYEDPGPGHNRDNRSSFHQERFAQESGRYGRDGTLRRYDREERMLRPGSGGNGYYYREGNSRPGPGSGRYDIEVISRPNSGGSDHGRERNNSSGRGSAYGGRQNFDRQMVSSQSYGPDVMHREAHVGRDSYEYRQDFNRQDGGYRHNANQFRPGGMNRDLPNRDGYGGRGGGFRRETYGRNSTFGASQYRDNVEQASANGRALGQPREWEGSFGQHSRTSMDSHGASYSSARALNAGYGADLNSRPRSGGYDGISSRPGSGGYGSNASGRTGSSDSMMGRPSYYGGRRSPVSQDKMVFEEFGNRPQGRYQVEGSFSRTSEMQSSDLGVQRPRSGGYGGTVGGRSMAFSDPMMGRPNFYHGHRSPISLDKMSHEEFSSRPQERYQFGGSVSRGSEVVGLDPVANRRLENSRDVFNEFDSHRPQHEFYEVEQKLSEECQQMAWDGAANYNLRNAEPLIKPEEKSFVPSEELTVWANQKLEVEQKFLGEEKGQYLVEEEQRMENVRKKLVELEGQNSKRKAKQESGEEGIEQEMNEEAVDHAIDKESVGESVGQQLEIHGHVEHVTSVREVHVLPSKDLYHEQDKLVDMLASGKILASPTPGPVHTDSAFNARSTNYQRGRDVCQETNSYALRSSSMSWRREPHDIINGPLRHGEYSRPQSKESADSERYQLF